MLLFILISILLLVISYQDVRYRLIANKLVIGVLGCVATFCYINDSLGNFTYWIWLCPLAFALWYIHMWGAGDAKLLIALLPAVSSDYLAEIFILIGLSGGVTALMTYLIAKYKKTEFITVPYGVPISVSCWLGILASL
ncbi:prepilin peptidase [Vibrio sp. HA2012]|uniref:prepilin peptidase n=1 Tax=Vibrio sp. HA2012 TaxID=1971595 RepID=UPI0012FDD7C9|nr:prepilin peptidase [Vibrio sp. HA2012]